MPNWPTVVAIVSLVQAVGYFFDEYHISSKWKDKTRLLLMKFFFSIDATSIPAVQNATLKLLLQPHESIGLKKGVVIFFGYFLAVTLFLWWLVIKIPSIGFAVILTIPLTLAVLPEMPISSVAKLLAYLLSYVLAPLLIFILMRALFWRTLNSRIAFVRTISASATIFLPASMVVVALLVWGKILAQNSTQNDPFTEGLMLSVIFPFVFIFVTVILGIIVKIIVETLKKLSLLVLEAASGPTVSPFKYAAALIGLFVVAAKAINP